METKENYLKRIGAASPRAALKNDMIDRNEEEWHLNRLRTLIRDLGTFTPYRELGRGGRSAS